VELSDVAKLSFLLSSLSMLIYYSTRRRTTQAPPLGHLRDLSSAFEALRLGSAEESFVVFIVPEEHDTEPKGDDANPSPNVQFSVEREVVGLDWVLISPANLEKEADFVRLAQALGHSVRRLRQNAVSYLRVEDGDVVELARQALVQLFDVGDDYPLVLVTDGVDWAPDAA
jgi:hypothetical protein